MLQAVMTPNHSRTTSAHVVQLFDSDESLADAVSAFLYEGFKRRETLLMVIDEQRWYSVAMRLAAREVLIDEVLQSGQLTVRDASDTLKLFMRRGKPDQPAFEDSVGQMIRDLSTRGAPLRIYGEMVNVLAAQGEYRAAHLLEELWNDLGRRTPFRLFCGYGSGHFGDPRHGESLRKICASHSHVLSNPQDVLGAFLLQANHVGR
jgi:hypothetical protein